MDPNPGGPKTCGSGGSGTLESATTTCSLNKNWRSRSGSRKKKKISRTEELDALYGGLHASFSSPHRCLIRKYSIPLSKSTRYGTVSNKVATHLLSWDKFRQPAAKDPGSVAVQVDHEVACITLDEAAVLNTQGTASCHLFCPVPSDSLCAYLCKFTSMLRTPGMIFRSLQTD